jgi:branched-chain amino acid transport system substrate-binding protein
MQVIRRLLSVLAALFMIVGCWIMTSGPASAASSKAPILIGGMCSCSSSLGSEAGTWDPYQAWINTVNAAGGINGHKVKLVQENDQGNPGLSVSDVKTLVETDHVIAIVDDTSDDEGWASFVQQAKVPVIGGDNSTEPFYLNPDFYSEGQTENALYASIIESAKSAKAKSLALIYCAESIQCQEGIAPLKKVGQQLGLPVTVASEVSFSAPSYTAQCITAQQANVGAVFVADVFSVVTKFISDCSTQGYNPIYVVDGLDLSPLFTAAKGALYAPISDMPYFANTPAIKKMNAAFDKYYPGMRKDTTTYSELDVGLWASALLFADAASAGGLGANGTTPTSAELVKGLSKLKGDTLGGIAPPLTFPAGKPHPIDCWFVSALHNGKFSLPNGTKAQCQKSS